MNQNLSGKENKVVKEDSGTDLEKQEWQSRVIDLRRVTRVVAGGKRFKFRATVVAGDGQGRVGVGVDKGDDVAQAIEKAFNQAKKKAISIPIINGTIPHEVASKYGAAKVFLKPAPRGAGVIAGGAVRVICELAGITNVSGKILSRSGSKINNARATIAALKKLKTIVVNKDLAKEDNN